ncbi:MAG: hypothetical protein V1934_07420 [Methanobacteriota archaeon]
MARKLPGCGGLVEIVSQKPARPSEFRMRGGLEEALGIGEYVPYPTSICRADFMQKLAVQKRILGRYGEAREMLDSARSYLAAWRHCVSGHEGTPGTFCYSGDFRNLMRAQFEGIDILLAELETYGEEDMRDFAKAIDFSMKWNLLQRKLIDTFFAHLAYYPSWLEIEGAPQAKRTNCADCHLFDAVAPPVPAFIALSALFMPRSSSMPDGTPVPEGILLHEKAGEFHEVHEHAHAYVHEKKKPGTRLRCEWIDEGIADWTAMAVTGRETKERSLYYEMYDFWLIVGSLSEEDRKELVRAWCSEPESYEWERLTEESMEAIRELRAKTRGKMEWASTENSDVKIELQNYRK